ncbi:MAG TPA: macro domain-containing protein [Candidatus Aminicenantes bacterium]|mgnify:CR=1 FL=1|nr:macro domain-containing protein [Candidatus Aminicenantes bacterium]
MERIMGDKKICLLKGNIALADVDAVVNAANESLVLGSGVAGAIREHGGPSIQEECNALAPVRTGGAVMTGAGGLAARHVIHAVGPMIGVGEEEQKLAQATLNSLKIAARKKFQSIAFPAISTGIFGFPMDKCSRIMLRNVAGFLRKNEFPKEVYFYLHDDASLAVFRKTLEKLGD